MYLQRYHAIACGRAWQRPKDLQDPRRHGDQSSRGAQSMAASAGGHRYGAALIGVAAHSCAMSAPARTTWSIPKTTLGFFTAVRACPGCLPATNSIHPRGSRLPTGHVCSALTREDESGTTGPDPFADLLRALVSVVAVGVRVGGPKRRSGYWTLATRIIRRSVRTESLRPNCRRRL